MISFVVPAHNEQASLGKTLAAIHDACRQVGIAYEIVVVDDASTDDTAAIARSNGAAVVSVNYRQIAATRNAGARAASGDRLFFVDADTTINERVVAAALRVMDNGAAGGGAPVKFDGNVPLYAPLMLLWINLCMRIAGITGGACMFCTWAAFDAAGGFDERLYGAEDAAFAWAVKRTGPFVVLWQHVVTSGRRTRGISGLYMIRTLFRMAVHPQMFKRRDAVGHVWYDSDRSADEAMSSSWSVRRSNAVLLLIVLAVFAGPVLNFVPWSITPPDRFSGQLRFAIAIFSCHVGLVLWPCAYVLVRILFWQNRWIERVKLMALIALCLYFGWGALREVFYFWRWIWFLITP